MSLTTKKRLALRQVVDQFSEGLVERADQTMSSQNMSKLKQLRLGQLNNLLGVTLETDSPAVVTNWINYQMGRRETKGGWGDSGLGEQVISDIKNLESSARQVAERVFSDAPLGPDELRQAHIALIRRYAGYLKRWFVARGGQQ